MNCKQIFSRLFRPLTMAICKNFLAYFNPHLMKNNLVFSDSAYEFSPKPEFPIKEGLFIRNYSQTKNDSYFTH